MSSGCVCVGINALCTGVTVRQLERDVDFIFGIRSCKALETAVGKLDEGAWQLLERTAASPISRIARRSPQVANAEVVQSIIERERR